MKRLFVLMTCAVLLSACATRSKPMATWVPPSVKPAPILTDAYGNAIENVPFRAGISSVTVEKMAQAQGCTSEQGAALMTPQGPVENYRMVCDSRHVFTARCEMRQCRQTSPSPVGGYVVRVPSDSRVVVTTAPVVQAPSNSVSYPVAAPMAAAPAASAATPSAAPASQLGPRQVPRLAMYWQCGPCNHNIMVPTMIVQGYNTEARNNGYTIAEGETAAVSIVAVHERGSAARLVGVFGGKETVSTKINFRGKTMLADDSAGAVMVNIDQVSQGVGKKVFNQIRAGL